MKPQNSIYILAFLLLGTGIKAQDIHLTSGRHTKTIKAGTFIEIELPVRNQEPCVECPINGLRGELISYADGIVNIKVKHSREPFGEGQINAGYTTKTYKNMNLAPTVAVERSDILSIAKKGKKKFRNTSPGEKIGSVLLLVGVAHIISAPIIRGTDEDSGNLLFTLGVTESVAGILMRVIFKQKQLITNESCPSLEKGKKIWELN